VSHYTWLSTTYETHYHAKISKAVTKKILGLSRRFHIYNNEELRREIEGFVARTMCGMVVNAIPPTGG
jgi:hypothetical protein